MAKFKMARQTATQQENLITKKIQTKPLKSKKKKLKVTKGPKVISEASRLLDSEVVTIVEPSRERESKIPKIRRSASSENVEENFMIVPWASREEWDNVCFQFHERNYKDVVGRIGVWKRRVPSLPVGVEATLFLLEALMYDEKLNLTNNKGYYTEDQARSLYSLAIIRYLNHVSQLATQSIGGPSKKLTRELAAIVDTPEWLVSLRNDVSHAPSAPSIEVLRMGGDFVLQWLKEKYWKLPDSLTASTTTATTNDPFTIMPTNDEPVNVSQQISELFAAYIAARIYKMRRLHSISDPEIIRHLPNQVAPVKTKMAVMTFKTFLRSYIVSHPSLFCVIVSQELIPNLEFYEDFKSIIKCKEAEDKEDLVFDKLYALWMPIIKLLESKGKLITILNNLVEVVVNPEFEKVWVLSARWMDKFLEIIEHSGKKYSKHLVNILRSVIKHPNYSMQHFLNRLFRLTEPRLGSDAVQKLAYLTSIWLEDISETKKRKKRSDVKLFTLSDIDEVAVVQNEGTEFQSEIPSYEETQGSSIVWMSDERSEEFWRTIPVGEIL